MIRRAALVLMAAALIAGCNRPPASQPPALAPETTTSPAPSAETPPGPSAGAAPNPTDWAVTAAMVLPQDGHSYRYRLPGDVQTEEAYVRDGDRLIGSSDGRVYVTWFVTPDGVYRLDPKGTVLLRYLPPVLPDGEVAWKQTSGDGEVWFSLSRAPDCHGHYATKTFKCWSLTVLNRGERISYLFGLGQGMVAADSANLARPAESYSKDLIGPAETPPPARETLLRDGARRPEGALPEATAVDSAAFVAAARTLITRYGVSVTAVDLDGDNTQEYLQGKLGEWHREPLCLFDHNGKPMGGPFLNESLLKSPTLQHKAEVVHVPGLPQPAIIYHYGNQPDTWHTVELWFLHNGRLDYGWGSHPKVDRIRGTYVTIGQDGTVEVTNNPADMVGYTWLRRYRISDEKEKLKATLVEEKVTAGAYPTQPEDLLTAAFIALWYKAPADLARYIPDETVRRQITERQDLTRPTYVPSPAKTGKLVWRKGGSPEQSIPDVASAPPANDGSTEFLVTVDEYDGATYFVGHVTFGKAPDDGRLIITAITFEKVGWLY